MRVLLLTPVPHYLAETITSEGDNYAVSMEDYTRWPSDMDFVVSFGYRKIIPEKVIDFYRGRIINIHMSMLPWNRGADPNFWSWFDRTPKGVSIHAVDAGIDTGDILVQREIEMVEGHTLKSSYSLLIVEASSLFAEQWTDLRRLDWNPVRVAGGGSYHRSADKERWVNRLPLGWDTPVKDVMELGAAGQDN